MSIRLPLKDLQICLYSYDSKTSLLDLENRPREEARRYLRWGHVTIRFLGYTEEGAPEFLVLGVATATKYGRRAGNALFQDFVVGTRRPNANQSVARDLDGGIIAVAILQGAMHGDLLRVIKEQSLENSSCAPSAIQMFPNMILNARTRIWSAQCSSCLPVQQTRVSSTIWTLLRSVRIFAQ
jgi:hypothetical protein